MESARRIADAAISDLKEHREGPVTKRRRVEEEEESRRSEDPLSSCVRQVPASGQDSSSTTFSQSPERDNVHQGLDPRDHREKEDEKIYFDAEAVAEQELGEKAGEISVVKAKIIGGIAISGKTVQVMFKNSFLKSGIKKRVQDDVAIGPGDAPSVCWGRGLGRAGGKEVCGFGWNGRPEAGCQGRG